MTRREYQDMMSRKRNKHRNSRFRALATPTITGGSSSAKLSNEPVKVKVTMIGSVVTDGLSPLQAERKARTNAAMDAIDKRGEKWLKGTPHAELPAR